MTDSTDTGLMATLRGKRKKRIRLQRKRHAAIETHTYNFVCLGFSLTSLHGITATSWSSCPLGIFPVPRHVGQVSLDECPFMEPYGGSCCRVLTFSIPLVGSGPSDVLLFGPGRTMRCNHESQSNARRQTQTAARPRAAPPRHGRDSCPRCVTCGFRSATLF